MSRQVLRVAWYRVLATARRRLAGYLGLAVVIGLTGGVAVGSAAAATARGVSAAVRFRP
ncbi:MAG TPA: hypothetical protein VKG80_17845 [Trebonia sp.]|nr:hypothetical protein [Trebonia sp.]